MKTILSAILLWICYCNSPAQWVELNIGNLNTYSFSDVYAITPDTVVVVGSNGAILKTTDGGTTWQQKNGGTTANLGEVHFSSPNVGYVTAIGGKVLKTTDGGNTWTSIDLGTTTIFLSLFCVNENLIFLSALDVNNQTLLFKTKDGGFTWESTITTPNTKLKNMQFFNENIGYARTDGYPYKILKTIDGGKNWIQLDNSYIPSSFINENIGFYCDFELYRTTDGGDTFSLLMPQSDKIKEIFVVNEHNIWGLLEGMLDGDGSTRGIIKINSDESETYSKSVVYDNNKEIDMRAIHFANEITGYIIGLKDGKSAIWKNGTGINTPGDLSISDTIITSFKIYPNPTTNEVNIDFGMLKAEEATVSIVDLAGKLVYSQSHKISKSLKINTSHFTKGNYLGTVEQAGKRISQKLIIQ